MPSALSAPLPPCPRSPLRSHAYLPTYLPTYPPVNLETVCHSWKKRFSKLLPYFCFFLVMIPRHGRRFFSFGSGLFFRIGFRFSFTFVGFFLYMRSSIKYLFIETRGNGIFDERHHFNCIEIEKWNNIFFFFVLKRVFRFREDQVWKRFESENR